MNTGTCLAVLLAALLLRPFGSLAQPPATGALPAAGAAPAEERAAFPPLYFTFATTDSTSGMATVRHTYWYLTPRGITGCRQRVPRFELRQRSFATGRVRFDSLACALGPVLPAGGLHPDTADARLQQAFDQAMNALQAARAGLEATMIRLQRQHAIGYVLRLADGAHYDLQSTLRQLRAHQERNRERFAAAREHLARRRSDAPAADGR